MSTYDDYLYNDSTIEMEIGNGICTARIKGSKVSQHKYVSGDMEDKQHATIRAYKDLIKALVGGDNAE